MIIADCYGIDPRHLRALLTTPAAHPRRETEVNGETQP